MYGFVLASPTGVSAILKQEDRRMDRLSSHQRHGSFMLAMSGVIAMLLSAGPAAGGEVGSDAKTLVRRGVRLLRGGKARGLPPPGSRSRGASRPRRRSGHRISPNPALRSPGRRPTPRSRGAVISASRRAPTGHRRKGP